METIFEQMIDLLTKSQGGLVYHLVLAFSIVSSLQAAAAHSGSSPRKRRMVFGLALLLLGQVVLFFSSALAWPGILNEHLFLPPLDRAIFLFSLVWVVWLWGFPTPARLGDLVTGFLNLGVLLLFLFTYTSWVAQGANLPFNNSWMDWVWELAALFVVLTGMGIVFLARQTAWGFGIGMLGLILAGVVAHLFFSPASGDLSGYLRLGQLAAFPLLPTLLRRLNATKPEPAAQISSLPQLAESPATAMRVPSAADEVLAESPANTGTLAINKGQEEPPATFPRQHERRRYSADPRTVRAWIEVSQATEATAMLNSLAKALGHTLLADLCYLVSHIEYGHIVLQTGFDLIREESLQGVMIEQTQAPALSSAVQRSKALRMSVTDERVTDLHALSAALGLNEAGSLMYVPFSTNDRPQGGVLFLSPYAKRVWSVEDQNYLATEFPLIAQIFEHIQAFSTAPDAPEPSSMPAEMENLLQENQRLMHELDQTLQAAAQPIGADGDLTDMIALQQETQDQLARLQGENQRLQSALTDKDAQQFAPEIDQNLEHELRATLEEVAMLRNELAQANARSLELERDAKSANVTENHQVLVSLVQDMRQPLATMVGYTDLLLSETAGIVGAMQRSFLDRVHAATERMNAMLADLMHVTALGETHSPRKGGVALDRVIDHAIAETSAQIREKDISLRVDLPGDLPLAAVEQDAMEQIVLHLLQNAGAATPQDGTVAVRVRLQEEQDHQYLLLQVMDSGGGVQPADISQVFSRRYRADVPLIQGLGDTGVGLAIAKTLTEAYGGRIWVDSAPGKGTAFSVLLPLQASDHSVE